MSTAADLPGLDGLPDHVAEHLTEAFPHRTWTVTVSDGSVVDQHHRDLRADGAAADGELVGIVVALAPAALDQLWLASGAWRQLLVDGIVAQLRSDGA